MKKLEKIYEGKAKQLFTTEDENLLIQFFKDDATAFNAQKKAVIEGKGVLNNLISEHIMLEMAKNGIPTHFVKRLNEREQLVKKVKIIPLEVIVRNITAGSMAKRLGIEEGRELLAPVFEICFKDDALSDPLINDDHVLNVLKIVSRKQLDEIRNYALSINQILQKIFKNIGIKLVDFKIEFGFDAAQNIILADEISPDSCRLWDEKTSEKMDKDRFRRDLGGLIEAYEEVAKRLGIQIK
ncbi:MAG: phosphoribosylaminoimidazolesuccinocarboxamide synthase [Alphaproteobacteria bacterium RIFCSPLOWO2_01_FULL_40_26]|nr:MAG: phosphoribosylaminoimidazolesuccinocarboxamide synthase [Alphaproteobacteria bacterium RIFCSPHIGHO2_01_FULL_40_8]OFW93966.1 MAG: phosphoribosylaminoimidazolesuccinocarboxamide synthase [Alphaproteobacteria bacterium RIFCSPLOWO2_01_FULL_40_26]OFX09678.1 MAG: phosphoribosylaminoimidazolesuccinocarboxamide synthase [Alphaproteobacteria bacterium RIFCSPLOWO2_02_FULL_40_19]OFX10827.1 MAG: phosphoribosylaminoimidazolesuccinocarboxamide synthase [Alphaproteobacteria bacterium RIFCSPLOWO2_12_FUL